MAYAHGCYSIYHSQTYPTLTLYSMAHVSPSVPNALTSLCTALASAVYTLCMSPITHPILSTF
ncbi:BCN_G0028660.mRNA.1.CDS.1 [Saccharomyces cerevisiae]|nr:BCN_G0028660.mRNA.1.CDS.1 [Saccharomyces cerevisiae]CAI7168771.1 BCN_G0028660.mRNA.1.CDS.1 [Saccharomyces cerevisiae]